MPTLPTYEPLMISEPDQAPAAVENLHALELVTLKEARVLSVLALRGERMYVERGSTQRQLRVRIGEREWLRVLSNGRVKHLAVWA